MNLLSRTVNRIGRFFVVVVRSCYDMEFYRDVRRAQSTAAFRYVVTFHATVVLLGALMALPGVIDGVAGARAFVASAFPDGARVEMRGGKLSTSLAAPTSFGDERLPVVVDTTRFGTTPPEPIGKGDAIFVGRDAVFVQEEGGESWNVASFGDVSDFSFEKGDVISWLDAYGTLAAVLATAGIGFLLLLGLVVSTTVFVLLTAILTNALARLGGVSMTYDQWLAVGFHAVTLPHLLNVAFAFTETRIPLAFTVVFSLFVVAVATDERANPVGPKGDAAPPPAAKIRKIARPQRKKPPAPPKS
jgi:hypothetical protein